MARRPEKQKRAKQIEDYPMPHCNGSFDASQTTTDSHARACPICGQPVTPDAQKTWKGETFYIYTCRNLDCESGIREITLDTQQFLTLTLDIVRSYPIPVTAAMKAVAR